MRPPSIGTGSSTRTRTTGWPIDQTLWLLGQEFVEVTAQVFPTTEDPEAENDVDGAVNLAGAQRDRGVQGLGGLGVGGMGQAAAVSPVTSFQTANRRVISVR